MDFLRSRYLCLVEIINLQLLAGRFSFSDDDGRGQPAIALISGHHFYIGILDFSITVVSGNHNTDIHAVMGNYGSPDTDLGNAIRSPRIFPDNTPPERSPSK